MTDSARKDFSLQIVECLLECVRQQGKSGLPVDILWDVLADYRCTWRQFTYIVGILLRAKLVKVRGKKFYSYEILDSEISRW